MLTKNTQTTKPMILLITTVILLLIIAAICNSVMDTLKDHFDKSIFSKFKNQQFWNPRLSWINKWDDPYDDPLKEKFWGSSRWFVFVTDAWHFFQFLMLTFIQLAIAILMVEFLQCSYWWLIPIVIVLKALWGGPFELFYSKILIKK